MSRQISINKEQIYEEIKKLVAEGKTVSITAKGYSMNPFLMHMRDQIILGSWEDKDVRRGTVAFVRDSRGNVLIHRIIKRTGNIIILEGDGNIGQQERAAISSIAGVMHSAVRKGRTYSVHGIIWRIYSWLWLLLRPVRRYPLAIWRRLNPQPPLR